MNKIDSWFTLNPQQRKAMNVIWRIIDDYCENCINDSEDKDEEIAHIEKAMDIIYEGLGHGNKEKTNG